MAVHFILFSHLQNIKCDNACLQHQIHPVFKYLKNVILTLTLTLASFNYLLSPLFVVSSKRKVSGLEDRLYKFHYFTSKFSGYIVLFIYTIEEASASGKINQFSILFCKLPYF